jgi:hypothetical protein
MYLYYTTKKRRKLDLFYQFFLGDSKPHISAFLTAIFPITELFYVWIVINTITIYILNGYAGTGTAGTTTVGFPVLPAV